MSRTRVAVVDHEHPAPGVLAEAARLLRAGGLVAFPTETVYGLGANALDASASARIFLAKGRPATNPVIVHVHSLDAARQLTACWPTSADRLVERFWPGPLSLVLPKRPIVPDLVTAGGPTVAVRVPAHPVALALLRAADLPIAAPSANRSNELSPTQAEHVLRGLDDRIDLLLDAGPASGGLESTVVDLSTDPPRLLRPGLVTLPQLRAVLGDVATSQAVVAGEPLRSPGQLSRHYAPRTPTEVSADSPRRVRELTAQGQRVGWLLCGEDLPAMSGVATIVLPADPVRYAAELYAALHTLDAAGLDRLVVAAPPTDEDWLAVNDRLRRAAQFT